MIELKVNGKRARIENGPFWAQDDPTYKLMESVWLQLMKDPWFQSSTVWEKDQKLAQELVRYYGGPITNSYETPSKVPKGAKARFMDEIVLAKPGERIEPIVVVDRNSPEYRAGKEARIVGESRDMSRSVNWLWGWDEAIV